MSERNQKYKGKYRPQNPEKYMGDSRNIIYRSMWERKCMKYFDNNPSAEEIPKNIQSVFLLKFKPLQNKYTDNAQKGSWLTFTLNSGVL